MALDLGAVLALTEGLAARGVTVNAVAPGFIETRMTAAMPALVREGARRLSALGQRGHAARRRRSGRVSS